MPASSPAPLAPSSHLSHSRQQSRSTSPIRYEIADFQDVHLAHPTTARTARDSTRYCPDPSPQQDFEGAGDTYRQITNAFLGKLPLISRATSSNPPSASSNYSFPGVNSNYSLPPSGASSPTKSLASFITSNTSDTTASSRRTRHTSKSVIDSWFNGTSAPINVGILPSPARSESPEQQLVQAEEYDIDLAYGNMEAAATACFTSLPPRTRRSRTSTTQVQTSSPGVAAKLGGWFTSKSHNNSSPSSRSPSSRAIEGITPSDPLLNLDITTALFPHGPADPLEPSSFHDLLTAAESIISNMQDAYRTRCAEIRELKCEVSVKDEETDEAETRARHLKMQLEDMAKQVSIQEAKTEMLERMLAQQQRETRDLRRQSLEQSSPKRISLRLGSGDHTKTVSTENWKRTSRTGASDSGFESDGDNDSIFSLTGSPVSSSASTIENDAAPTEAEKVRLVRVGRGHDAVLSSNVARAYAPIEMRIENQRLRERVLELEQAVEGCLDLVAGPLR